MPVQLRLQPYQLLDLAEIRDIDLTHLKAILERFRGLQPLPMRPKELDHEIAAVLSDRPEAAARVLRTLLSLFPIIVQRKLSAEEVVEGVRHAIESSEPKWNTEEMVRWRQAEALFKELLLSPAVRTVASILDMTYEYENLLQGVRVITDIRPVFSDDAQKIDAAVVSHTLRLRYDSTEGNHNISIAMDENDIRDLENQCKRALQKSQTARGLMEDQAKVPTIIAGDSSNEEE